MHMRVCARVRMCVLMYVCGQQSVGCA